MPAHRSLRDFDWLMLVLVCAICALGVLQIFSATRDTHFTEAWWKQVIWIVAGFVAMWIGDADRLSHAAGASRRVLRPVGGHADRHVCRWNDAFSGRAAGSAPPAIIFRSRNSLNW